jgi:PKD repeat protein
MTAQRRWATSPTLTAKVTAGTNITYTWDFGDGTMGEGAVVHQTYPAAGTYTAVITANNTINALTDTTTGLVDEAITGLRRRTTARRLWVLPPR